MKLTETKLDENRVRIDAVASAEEVDAAFAVVAEQAACDDTENFAPQVAEHLIPFALNEVGILPAFPPHASFDIDPEKGKTFSFEVEVLIKPSYELRSYESVEISIPGVQVKDFEVDEQLVQIADSYAEFIADDPRPILQGDSVMMSMEAFDNAQPIPELTINKRTYITGAHMMPPDFDENIVGMEPGQTKKFQIKGPVLDEDGNEIEKTVDCEVTILEIQKKVIPTITDTWIKETIPAFENVAQLREEVKRQILEARVGEQEEMKRQAAVAELCSRFEGDITQEIHEENKKALKTNITTQLEIQGIAMDWFIEQNGGQENFDVSLAMQTTQSLIEGYALDALFRYENMNLDDADVVEACKTVNPEQPEAVKDQMEKSGYAFALRETASRIKANKWLVDNAQITESNE